MAQGTSNRGGYLPDFTVWILLVFLPVLPQNHINKQKYVHIPPGAYSTKPQVTSYKLLQVPKKKRPLLRGLSSQCQIYCRCPKLRHPQHI